LEIVDAVRVSETGPRSRKRLGLAKSYAAAKIALDGNQPSERWQYLLDFGDWASDPRPE
jgi:hypothetical protein